MRRSGPAILAAILTLAAGAACVRGVDFDRDPGQLHAIDVTNALARPMIVSFDDGSGERLLGTVAASSTERFVVAGAAATTVSIIAHDEDGTRSIRRTVTLVPGRSVAVRLD